MNSEWVKGKSTAGNGLWQVYSIGTNLTTTTPALPSGAVGWQAVLSSIGATCQTSTTQNWNTKGYSWSDGGCGIGGCYSHLQPPNKKACVFANQKEGYSATVIWSVGTMVGASPITQGGVNVGMLDGSVRFVKDSVSLATWGSNRHQGWRRSRQRRSSELKSESSARVPTTGRHPPILRHRAHRGSIGADATGILEECRSCTPKHARRFGGRQGW